MKILIISESIWHLGPVFDLHIITEELANNGHEVHVLDAGEFRNSADRLALKRHNRPRYREGVTINVYSPSFPHREFRSVRNPITWVTAQLSRSIRKYQILKKIIQRHEFDIIISYSAVRYALPLLWTRKILKNKLQFRNVDMLHKLWPTLFERTIAKYLERITYKICQRIYALTPDYRDYLIRMGANGENIEVIGFPIDTQKFNNINHDIDIRGQYHIKNDDFILLFIGGLYRFGDLDSLIRIFPELKKISPSIKLLIVGDGESFSYLQELVLRNKLSESVILTGLQPFESMPNFIHASDICLNCFKISKETEDIFSAKIIQYLAANKPVISTALKGTMTTFPAKHTGVIYCLNAQEMINEVERLYRQPKILKEHSGLAKKYISDQHECSKVIQNFEKLFKADA